MSHDCVLDDDLLLLPVLSVILKMYKYRCLHFTLLPSHFAILSLKHSKTIISVKFVSYFMDVQCR